VDNTLKILHVKVEFQGEKSGRLLEKPPAPFSLPETIAQDI
jgi:hypothetical protein